MNVLLVSTSERCGGGAIAARRLMEALCQNGVKARMMVRDKQSDAVTVCKVGNKLPKALERLAVLPRCDFDRTRMWQADIANVGIDITTTREFQEADIIHLHWINQGMLSLGCIERILNSGKRVVWTLHDEWPYLGVCHYRGDCASTDCLTCPVLKGSLPHRLLVRKLALYRQHSITFAGCSQWITNEARKAMPDADVRHINNCIPARLFHPTDMAEARCQLGLPTDRQLLLFCSQKVTDERKGIRYLSEALRLLPAERLHLVIVGKDAEQIPLPDGISVTRLGSVAEQDMPQVYNAADCFLTPSLQDNLPNTIAEAMSCGTPCVGFRIGGIPEMIDHLENGYVARYQDACDLADGIRYVLSHELREAARHKAATAYGETHVAQQYLALYNSILTPQNDECHR